MAICPSCFGVIGRDCFNQVDCAAITGTMPMDIQEAVDSPLQQALDFIKELCDVLEHNPNDIQTTSNAIMNAMAFRDDHLHPDKREQKLDDLGGLPF